MKKRLYATFGIGVLLVSLVLSALILPYASFGKASATASQDASTFLDFRSSVRVGSVNHLTKTFQHNSNNFNYTPAYRVADLRGALHSDRTLVLGTVLTTIEVS